MKDRLTDFFTNQKFRILDSLKLFRGLPLVMRVVVLSLFLGTFVLFRFLSYQDKLQASRAISSMLRNENVSVNAYTLSKTLSDLELLHLLSCSTLQQKTEQVEIYFDTSNGSNCFKWRFLKNIFEVRSEVQAINGSRFQLTFQLPFKWSMFFSEILSYMLIAFAFGIYANAWIKQKINHELRLKAVALEKTMVIEMANQVRHDVASPLSALRTILRVLNNVDPEIKSFLERAVTRTEELFGQLSHATGDRKFELGSVDLHECLKQIVEEKSFQWEDKCEVHYENQNHSQIFVLANEVEFKRVVSNLMNNAFEAVEGLDTRRIGIQTQCVDGELTVRISDTGNGIPAEIIHKLGEKGFSFGKEGHPSAGSGLGIYHAREVLKDWGGCLDIKSALGQGTEVSLKLKVIQS